MLWKESWQLQSGGQEMASTYGYISEDLVAA